MSRSPFFARIKRDVLLIMRSVPAGQAVTFTDIGEHLDVMPRHVAHILATLDPLERETVPWHRALRHDGAPSTRAAEQGALLRAEGQARIVPVATLPHGVPRQTRPPEAPRVR